MKITILGSGSSGGVPLITGNWGVCDPNNPKNNRMRASILVQVEGKNILIDTSPDLRTQLLAAKISTIDAVLLTHAHADHLHGLDELRQIYFGQQRKIPLYAHGKCLERAHQAFSYMFQAIDSFYPTFLGSNLIEADTFEAAGIPIQIFEQHHGHQRSSGFRIGNMAYSTDVKAFPVESEKFLNNLDLWIVDALRYEEHPNHAHVTLALEWIEKFRPKNAVLTHLSEHLDYAILQKKLPAHVYTAYDGMVWEVLPNMSRIPSSLEI